MASQVDEAERRVREQRLAIQRKVADLEERVSDDVAHARGRVKHHVTHTADMLPGGPAIIEQVERHPVTAMAGGLGLGVAAGMLGGRGGRHNQHADVGHDGSSVAGMATFLGTMSNSLLSPLRPYMEDAAKQVIAGFADRQRSPADTSPRTGSQPAP